MSARVARTLAPLLLGYEKPPERQQTGKKQIGSPSPQPSPPGEGWGEGEQVASLNNHTTRCRANSRPFLRLARLPLHSPLPPSGFRAHPPCPPQFFRATRPPRAV